TNLIDILAASRDVEPAQVEQEMAAARGYGDRKGAVADAVVEMLEPVQQRYEALRGDEEALEGVLAAGASRASEIAAPTVADVRRVMGVGPPPGR
ncbi:MAG: tryptophan--tRNA ligase, partial [Solirubrobacterales bacterium]